MSLSRETSPIVPVSGSRNILITSALPYVNDMPHLGNIIGSVLSADVFARYCRARGLNTLYIGGTDEYGTATEIRAGKDGCTPKELCDRFHKIHADIYQWFNISFDKFGRTTTQNQTDIAQQIFLKVHENGFLHERVTSRLYCETHERFLADRYVIGDCPHCGKEAKGDECDTCGSFDDAIDLKNPRCNLDACGSTPITRDTKHLFFRLDRLQSQVEAFSNESAEKGKWPNNGKGQTVGWLKQGLKERSITRDIKFGTPVPPSLSSYEDKVIYNWFDAPIGYLSITAEYTEKWRDWWQPENPEDVQLYQFIGKDNVFFHSIFFPATQIATGENWTKVHHLSTTDYLQYEGTKFSKSKGIGVFGDQAKNSGIKADVWRFYLLYYRPEDRDTDFTWDAFIAANNNLLLKKLGNFVNRVIKFVNNPRYYDGVVPDSTQFQEYGGSLLKWEERINSLLGSYVSHLDAVELRSGLATILEICDAGNELAHEAHGLFLEEEATCAAIICGCLNLIYLLAVLLQPFLPDTAESITRQLRVEPVLDIPDVFDCGYIAPGHKLGEAEPLFTKVDPKQAEEWKAQCGDEAMGSKEATCKKKEIKKTKNGKTEISGSPNGTEWRKGKESREEQQAEAKSAAAAPGANTAVENEIARALNRLSFE
ncbi:hypothetical protein J7T55_001429 [Diaporthe amygdali]|uniref:uncharacterized protein n=1 Tax=Phomopsis amygdali TaxID=1214568 RepID=UPI0022FE5B9C|nr:uncharacterized protein J7T55_001429 [Diaporthe amygdali]KAJ0115021.1 hypothetical protein J7T55_001429 [Diaporthe amygdali]